jgi:hypothetical protein
MIITEISVSSADLLDAGRPAFGLGVHSHSGPKPAFGFRDSEGRKMKAAPRAMTNIATNSSVLTLPARSGFHRGQFITSTSAFAYPSYEMALIWVRRKQKFLCTLDWTASI